MSLNQAPSKEANGHFKGGQAFQLSTGARIRPHHAQLILLKIFMFHLAYIYNLTLKVMVITE